MKAYYKKYILNFYRPSGTSRGILTTKETFFLHIENNGENGVGECALFRGLSFDDRPEYEDKLKWLCENIALEKNILKNELIDFPSIWFGYEQAMLNLEYQNHIYFPSKFTKGLDSITINGLIWMGTSYEMEKQINEKIRLGYNCIKLKIGVNWETEYQILKKIRQEFPSEKLELRVDANGAFSYQEVLKVLNQLAELQIHSIEQPIKKSHLPISKIHNSEMAKLCKVTPMPIALDEELIGINIFEDKKEMLQKLLPQFIILKPALVGGFSGTDEWITIAEELGIGWWITSALESNIGLNAIAQYTYTKNNKMPQGLGTGSLFSNNFKTPIQLKGKEMWFLS